MAMSDERDPSLSSLYRLGASEEPSPALDARILAAARRETATVPVRRRPAWIHWLAPMGVAATVVLSISLILISEREEPDLLPAAAPMVAPSMPEPQALPAQAGRSASPPAPEPALAKKREAAAAFPLAKSAAPASSERRMQKEAAPAAEQSLRAIAPVAPVPAGAPAAAISAARPAAPATKLELQRADGALRSPEIWLEDIRRLKNQGQVDALREQLAAFRRAYPDYPLPADLQAP